MSEPKHMRVVEEDRGVRPKESSGNTVLYKVFLCVLGLLLVAPLVCMPFVGDDTSQEKRELAQPPALLVDGLPNAGFLEDAGAYFLDHFAFRNVMVDLDATLKQCLFMTSSTENVVVGQDGWLYYAGSLNDYQRKNTMSERAIWNATHNLSLVQEYVTSQGKQFAVAIAPNKNELYPEHMPYYQLAGEGESNASRLITSLRDAGVNVVDLHEAFLAQGDVLYFARDSHWNDRGALLAYQSIVRALGREPVAFENGELEEVGHRGDVDGMLHPVMLGEEMQEHYVGVDAYEFVNDATSVEESYLIANASQAATQDSLIMYRDSYGNNLLAPFASTYRQSVFTKLVPYDMGTQMIAFANDVVVERAERHVSTFASNPPYLPAPLRGDAVPQDVISTDTTLYARANGPYLMVEGTVDDAAADAGSRIYVSVEFPDGSSKVFEAFCVSAQQDATQDEDAGKNAEEEDAHVTSDWGYRAYLSLDAQEISNIASIGVLVETQGRVSEVARGSAS